MDACLALPRRLSTFLTLSLLSGYTRFVQVECWTYGVDAGLALLRRLVGQGFQPDRATWSTLLACERHWFELGLAVHLRQGSLVCNSRSGLSVLLLWFEWCCACAAKHLHGGMLSWGQAWRPGHVSLWRTCMPCATHWPSHRLLLPSRCTAAKHAKRGDISDLALAELAAFQRRQDDAAAEAARQEEEAAAAQAAAAGRPLPAGDHRWHGYYEQQQEEDEDDW